MTFEEWLDSIPVEDRSYIGLKDVWLAATFQERLSCAKIVGDQYGWFAGRYIDNLGEAIRNWGTFTVLNGKFSILFPWEICPVCGTALKEKELCNHVIPMNSEIYRVWLEDPNLKKTLGKVAEKETP